MLYFGRGEEVGNEGTLVIFLEVDEGKVGGAVMLRFSLLHLEAKGVQGLVHRGDHAGEGLTWGKSVFVFDMPNQGNRGGGERKGDGGGVVKGRSERSINLCVESELKG